MMAASGSPPTTRALCISTTEKRTSLDKQMACLAMMSSHSLKIERTTFGLQPRTAWTDSVPQQLLPFLLKTVCPIAWHGRFLLIEMEVFGLPRLAVSIGGVKGNSPRTTSTMGSSMDRPRLLFFRTVAGEYGCPPRGSSDIWRVIDLFPWAGLA